MPRKASQRNIIMRNDEESDIKLLYKVFLSTEKFGNLTFQACRTIRRHIMSLYSL